MMEHSAIVEKGTHDELLAARGRTPTRIHSQFAGWAVKRSQRCNASARPALSDPPDLPAPLNPNLLSTV